MRKTFLGITLLATLLTLAILPLTSGLASAQTRLLATTFPVYQLVRTIVAEVPGVEVQLMLPAQAGCPHDYALTPQDMTKLAQADILVINGQGMEAFLGSPSAHTKKELRTVDSSKGVSGLLAFSEEEHDGHEEHHHPGMNPHLFASPRMAAQMARSIAGQLAELEPDNAAAYWNNAENLARRLDTLADDFAALGRRLKNTHIVTQHGVFDYLARDMGLTVVAVVQSEDTQMPSAAEMLQLIKTIKETQAGAIFTEPQYPDKIAAMLSRETGVPTAKLDPVATGPANAAPDYYETVMRDNLRTLEATLGVH